MPVKPAVFALSLIAFGCAACSEPPAARENVFELPASRTPALPDPDTACRYAQMKANDVFRGLRYFQLRPVGAHWSGDTLKCLLRYNDEDGRLAAKMTCSELPYTGAVNCFQLVTVEAPYGTYFYGGPED